MPTDPPQDKNSSITPFLTSPTSELISSPLFKHEITGEQADILINGLIEARKLQRCNLTYKPQPFSKKETWWDTCKDSKVYTINVDQSIFTDLQRLSKIGDNFEKTVLELIAFYAEHSALNIILEADVMESRTSYYKYTAQFAHSLKQAQQTYHIVNIKTDPSTYRLGIFCRKDSTGIPKKSFLDNLVSALRKSDSQYMYIEWNDLPATYKGNLAMLKQHLRNFFPECNIITVKKSGPFVNISISPAKTI
jgi:hypothetical protein